MDYKTRNDVPNEYKWDLSKLYKNDDEWEKDYNIVSKRINEIVDLKSIMLKSAKSLFDTLELYYDIEKQIEKIYVYASLSTDSDLKNSDYVLMSNKAYNLYVEYSSNSVFITPLILKNSTIVKKYLSDPILLKYKFCLEKILKTKKHMLNEKEEFLISRLTKNDDKFSDIANTLLDSTINYGTIIDEDGKSVDIIPGNYSKMLRSKDRRVRKEASEKYHDALKMYNDIFSKTLLSCYDTYSEISKIRKYNSTIEMCLDSEDVPRKVVDTLYKIVNSNLNIYQDYFKYMKEVLNLDELKSYDLAVSFVNNDKKYSIDEIKSTILESLSPLGSEYNSILKKAFDERWIDFCTYKGKTSGAYSSCNCYNPYVLMNYRGIFDDISTVAHELGHSVNSYLSFKNCNYHEGNNTIFLAEIASLTNEVLLANYIIKNSNDKKEKLTAIYNLLFVIQNNLFDACLEGEFENIIHERINDGEILGTEDLNECIYNIRKKYYGDTVVIDDGMKYMWERRSHYYRPFYLFKYATSMCAAIYVAVKIINGDNKMLKNYLEFLKKGSSDNPINILKTAGIDLNNEKVYKEAIDYFEYLLNEYKRVNGSEN